MAGKIYAHCHCSQKQPSQRTGNIQTRTFFSIFNFCSLTFLLFWISYTVIDWAIGLSKWSKMCIVLIISWTLRTMYITLSFMFSLFHAHQRHGLDVWKTWITQHKPFSSCTSTTGSAVLIWHGNVSLWRFKYQNLALITSRRGHKCPSMILQLFHLHCTRRRFVLTHNLKGSPKTFSFLNTNWKRGKQCLLVLDLFLHPS